MGIDLTDAKVQERATRQHWRNQPDDYWEGLTVATEAFPAPVVALQVDALAANAADLLRRAGGLPIRLASKSLRARSVIHELLRQPGFQGVLAYSLAEAVWLAGTVDDVLVAYPSVNREAIRELVTSE